MEIHCPRCKKNTSHRKITDYSMPDEPFEYYACDDCGEPDLQYSASSQLK